MTTAARPTFEPARGGQGRGEKDLSAMSKQYSSRDLPSHNKLKFREYGQGTSEELRGRDFRRELDERERVVVREGKRGAGGGGGGSASGAAAAISSVPPSSAAIEGGREAREGREPRESHAKKPRLDQIPTTNLDADDPLDADDSNSEDSEDDTAELMAELQRIKKERSADQARKEAERRQEEERIRMENILSGNPLLNYAGAAPKADLKVKRRWDDDVVFKNCARAEPERMEKHFINDSLRSEFHKKFMEKYIK